MPEPFAGTTQPESALHGNGPAPDAHAEPAPGEVEVVRLEKLLASRAREVSALRAELERRSRLLHDAVWRMGETIGPEIAALRGEREAAVERALQAEVARAELTFRLDEVLGQLELAEPTGAARELRSVRAQLGRLEEAEANLRGQLALREQELQGQRANERELQRVLQEAEERFELALVREHGEARQASARDAAAAMVGLRGERDGLSARCAEAEGALTAALARGAHAERGLRDGQEALSAARAQAAELTVAVQARAAHVSELGQQLAREQQESRALRAQLTAAISAQRAERGAREADVQGWMQRLRELEQQSDEAAGAKSRHWAGELRDYLAGLRASLAQLTAALDGLERRTEAADLGAPSLSSVLASAGVDGAPAALSALEKKLHASETRVRELEAALESGAVSQRDAALAALKGELIDTRANANRVADDLSKERARRKRFVVTVRALQAALESGQAPAPWIDELVAILNEGASSPP